MSNFHLLVFALLFILYPICYAHQSVPNYSESSSPATPATSIEELRSKAGIALQRYGPIWMNQKQQQFPNSNHRIEYHPDNHQESPSHSPIHTVNEENIVSVMMDILKGLYDETISPYEILVNVEDLETLAKRLEKPALVVLLVSNKSSDLAESLTPFNRETAQSQEIGQYVQLDTSLSDRSTLLSQVFIPYMNRIAKNLEHTTGHRFPSIKMMEIPQYIQKQHLLMIHDLSKGHVLLHPAFFDAFSSMEGHLYEWISTDNVQQFFESVMNAIDEMEISASKPIGIKDIESLILKFPNMLLLSLISMNPSFICIACMLATGSVVPIILNYLCYGIAQAICAILHLSFDTCIHISISSLAVAYVLIFPVGIALFFLCKKTVCNNSMISAIVRNVLLKM